MNDFLKKMQERLLFPLPGVEAQLKMAPATRINQLHGPKDAKQSGVMVLLFMENEEWHTLLMHRTEDGTTHGGQISFPGGKKEPADIDLVATALRECEEEIGIKQNEIQTIGSLSPLYIPPSNFHVAPSIGVLSNDFQFNISTQEVQEVYKVPLTYLFNDNNKDTRVITTSTNLQLLSPVYVLQNSRVVWGATAMILSELEHLIKEFI